DTADITVNIPTADLSLSKVASDPSPLEGDTITYTITILNTGPDAATAVTVTDLLPSGVSYVSALPSQGSYVSGTGVWTVGSLASPSSATLVLTVTVDSGTGGTTITNTAEVSASDQADPDSTPNNGIGSEDDQDSAAITVQSADLSLTKIVDNATPAEGATIAYTVTVSNAGPDTATNVTVTDLLPTGVTYVSDLPSQGSYVSGSGVWTVGSITSGGSATLAITVTVDAATSGSTITNTAEVTASDQADPDSTVNNGVGSEDDQDTADITVA
ncbi:MAG: DUF11 domain-containing protein, partial [Acidimicrobiia bacterium]